MNTGVISTRYARALLLLTQADGSGEEVFAQARALLKDPSKVPAPLSKDLAKLVLLLKRNGRGEHLRLILNDYTRLYCASTGAKIARLTTAVPSPELSEKIIGLLGAKVYLDSDVDPSIEGGFLLTVDDMLMDASVKGQLERIRREFIARNQRIV